MAQKVYLLTDSDFDELIEKMRLIEAESKLKEPPSVFANTAEGRILARYHFDIIRWVQKMGASGLNK